MAADLARKETGREGDWKELKNSMCNPYDCQGRGQASLHAPDSSLEVIRSMEEYEAWWVGEWGEGRGSHFPIAWSRTASLTIASSIIITILFIYGDEQQRPSNLVGGRAC